MAKYIDLRSDTVTLPTPEMREAMYRAEVGDDVYGEDPTVRRLEEMAAEITGKEAAMFVTSGTQGNQVCIMTHTRPGDEIILEEKSHIFTYEVGGIGYLAGVQARLIPGKRGVMDPTDIEAAIREDDLHFPRTSLICVENTHNRAGGTVIPMDTLEKTYEVAKKHGIPVHMDGARIFNAATYLGVPVRDIARYADSVMFCLSKGLCAPVGSIVAGSRDFINRARKFRKMLGGGLRQAGFLAAAGIVALEKMTERLKEDHENARLLAEGLNSIPGISIDMKTVQTNIVICDISGLGISGNELAGRLLEKGIKINGGSGSLVRFVTHYGIDKNDVLRTVEAVKEIAAELN
ncbi:low-specificity L-threonine aldolase [Thermosediminibacter oceani]|uniref:L-threonine aldolase n=1 Tax=Thermosediminibacter oceani (strain ATCC BAA-1034 / DSM 16646 / JW/IW-1228P) TaxID=555079 RepID=D9S209_THEOJ|nr:low-specificity L-threonine aldolase [Thermosediminibacter oceani]ADL07436.1 L-threonine aldolase [Thermosediminibacter oceani DSM 16646]